MTNYKTGMVGHDNFVSKCTQVYRDNQYTGNYRCVIFDLNGNVRHVIDASDNSLVSSLTDIGERSQPSAAKAPDAAQQLAEAHLQIFIETQKLGGE